ncbi:interferon-inducible GTPase 5-like [Dendronephthya gigantea]|uniref:interferon-inducible GTPase 5-like n=1 Tax=Dendronephthya gigantea TaxID=151771 RepID=UPI0010693D8D|nr:interferon-inducible GTPase 5-like [Dendronephthya gigantea]
MAGLNEASGPGILNEVNIGLVGETQSGKTSFIKAIMRNNANEPPKTTATAMCFLHPNSPNIKLWDLPGLGTALYPDSEEYFERLDLEKKYSAFLLFTRETELSTTTQSLIIRLEAAWKPFVLIKSFIDVDVDQEKKSNENFNEGNMMVEIRKKLRKVLKDLDCAGEKKIILISNLKPEKWEFCDLKKTILNELPKRQSRECSLKKKDDLAFRLAKLSLLEKEQTINAGKEAWLQFLKKSQNTAKEIEEKGIEGVRREVEREIDSWRDIKIRMAIIGETGCGKSSFTNAIRGFEDVGDHDNLKIIAKTGIKETTLVQTEYKYPDNPNITLVDCPGIGTRNFRDLEAYSENIDIETYDVFIIMTASRFTADTGDLAKKVRLLNKPFLFVRTKIDDDQRNEQRKKKYNQVEFLEEIKEDCFLQLKSEDAELGKNDIFLISNHYPHLWDFARLIKAINNRLTIQKRECFLFSTIVLSKDILRQKVKALRGGIWRVSFFQSIFWKLITFTEYSRKSDFRIILENVEFYRKKLGFPNEESSEFKEMSPELQKELREFFLGSIADGKGVESWLKKFDRKSENENTETSENNQDEIALTSIELSEFPPWLDVNKAMETPYSFVSGTLNQVLDEMQELAIGIINEAVAREQAKLDMTIGRPRQENQQTA